MIKFAHIAPYKMAKVAHEHSDINLVLAHLVDEHSGYAEFYKNSNLETIMDNGAFELGEPYKPEKLIELGKKCGATYLVLPDYPLADSELTEKAALEYNELFKKEGFKTMFVPQSLTGHYERYKASLMWALKQDFDLIGLSIIGAPNSLAAGKKFRSYARFRILSDLALAGVKINKRIHMLGMLDTVREIALCSVFKDMIYSWDSSAAAWCAHRGLKVSEKFNKTKEDEVDFGVNTNNFEDLLIENIKFMQKLSEL